MTLLACSAEDLDSPEASKIGLLLKMQPLIDEVALYDIANVAGVAAGLSHCNTKTQV